MDEDQPYRSKTWFPISDVVYFKGSQSLDPRLPLVNSFSALHSLLDERLETLNTHPFIEHGDAEFLKAGILSRYTELASFNDVGFRTACGVGPIVTPKARAGIGKMPQNKMMHVLFWQKLSCTLLDACRSNDDWNHLIKRDAHSHSVRIAPSASKFNSVFLFSAADELTNLWNALKSMVNAMDVQAIMDDCQVDAPDAIFAALTGKTKVHSVKEVAHKTLGRVYELALRLRGWLWTPSEGESDSEIMVKYVDYFDKHLKTTGGEPRFKFLQMLYQVATYGPCAVLQNRRVKSTLKDIFIDAFLLDLPNRSPLVVQLDRSIWRLALAMAARGPVDLLSPFTMMKELVNVAFPAPTQVMGYLEPVLEEEPDELQDEAGQAGNVNPAGDGTNAAVENTGTMGGSAEDGAANTVGGGTSNTEGVAAAGEDAGRCASGNADGQATTENGVGDGSGGNDTVNDSARQVQTSNGSVPPKDIDPVVDQTSPNEDGGGRVLRPKNKDGRTSGNRNNDKSVASGSDKDAESDEPDGPPTDADDPEVQKGNDKTDTVPPTGGKKTPNPRGNKRPKPVESSDSETPRKEKKSRPKKKARVMSYQAIKAEFDRIRDNPDEKVALEQFILSISSGDVANVVPRTVSSGPILQGLKRDVDPGEVFYLNESGQERKFHLSVNQPFLCQTENGPPELQVHPITLQFRGAKRLLEERGDYARIHGAFLAAEETNRLDPTRDLPGRLVYMVDTEFDKLSAGEIQELCRNPVVIKATRNIVPLNTPVQEFIDNVGEVGRTRPNVLCSDALEDLEIHDLLRVQVADTCVRPHRDDGHEEKMPKLDLFDSDSDDEPDNMLRSATVEEIAEFTDGVLNCLSLSSSTGLPSRIKKATHYAFADQFAELNKFTLPVPNLGFALYGKESATSRIHCDPQGTCTFGQLNSGVKIWFIMSSEEDDKDLPTCSMANWRGWFSRTWDAAYLEEGDRLLMPPGRFHMVITLRDSVSVGNMFFMPSCYTLTFYTLVQLHLHGQRLCNSDYKDAFLILFRLVGYYHFLLEKTGLLVPNTILDDSEREKYGVLQTGRKIPSLIELASITCIVIHAAELTAQQNEKEEVYCYPSGYKVERANAIGMAEKIKAGLLSRDYKTLTHYTSLETHLAEERSKNANRLQRDLPEKGQPLDLDSYFVTEDDNIFLHDNEHELRIRDGSPSCPWDDSDPRPIHPSQREEGTNQDDCAEYSEGEYVPPMDYQGYALTDEPRND